MDHKYEARNLYDVTDNDQDQLALRLIELLNNDLVLIKLKILLPNDFAEKCDALNGYMHVLNNKLDPICLKEMDLPSSNIDI